MNLIEKILAAHSSAKTVKPGQIIDMRIDARVARDFGGANVVKNLIENGLEPDDVSKTFFTFDCDPGGSDQKYAANQHFCRQYAREKGIQVYDVNSGIGTHLAIDHGLILPGGTFVSTDSHANIMGAIGAFGQGMGDQDIAAVWASGQSWFKVPESVKLTLTGRRPKNVSAKDIVLNLLERFGANSLLGVAVEMHGPAVDELTLDERITIASMGTEMGTISILFTPTPAVIVELEKRSGKRIPIISADADGVYKQEIEVDISNFKPMVAKPGHPHDDIDIQAVKKTKIDSAFIGSCTNGRMEDLRIAAGILKGKIVAPGVVLKIVPATDDVWKEALEEGLIKIFKDAGALVSNAGCAGCAAGQVGQNGPNEITLSTGNRNFAGKQGKGSVYLASPAVAAASAVAGYITTPDDLPMEPATFTAQGISLGEARAKVRPESSPLEFTGKIRLIPIDDIDTDMIFHNRYLTITDIAEMGQYTFDNLAGYEKFAGEVQPGDIVVTAKNFGAGSSRQQAVDCFKSLRVPLILAESYGAIYERNAINAALPILTYDKALLEELELHNGDTVTVNLESGAIRNERNQKTGSVQPFSMVQMDIYKRGGLLNK
ncbi:3-isopropylmalate dehydratase large subunit [bacterium]|nr:3-isopropylmalate dehydratase large subunit [bacterium]MBU1065560.1 3-isopropylmalate dehydratase large subunit [bacterium]MBU1633768.1 3-isopropylmalate dehydratase large subunit [bacterium]MBU1873519.1 3-isopropylmalate dehydratase large subunit [bacterium]